MLLRLIRFTLIVVLVFLDNFFFRGDSFHAAAVLAITNFFINRLLRFSLALIVHDELVIVKIHSLLV